MSTISKQESLLLDEIDSNIIPPTDVVVFNEVRSCADLMRLHTEKQLNIDPDFQRSVVWSLSQQTRFIDSLAKQLPIPNICIAHDLSTKKRIVIDGLQRISSIIKFLDDSKIWTLTELKDVDLTLSGKSNQEIRLNNIDLYSEIQNLSIPVTMIRCDLSKKNHAEYIFTIFHRLNTGGSKLNNQEIRNGVYGGVFNQLLKTLAKSNAVIDFFGTNLRYRNEEAVLRLYSFYYYLDKYEGKLTSFLNDTMQNARELNQLNINSFNEACKSTFQIINKLDLDNQITIRAMSRTVKEGLFYGISKNISHINSISEIKLADLFNKFCQLNEYNSDNLKEGLAGKEKLINRLKAAAICFSK